MTQHTKFPIIPAIFALLLLVATSPLTAQDRTISTADKPKPAKQGGRVVAVPGYGTVYVVPEQPKDLRTPRQRCIDDEIAREGGSPSEQAMGAIDLKCSQR